MYEKKKINKSKGIEICTEMLHEGKTRKDILQYFQNLYNIHQSTVDKWLKDSRPIIEARQKEEESIRAREAAIAVAAAAKSLNISKERILEEYAKVAFFDIRKLFTEDGGLVSLKNLDEEVAAAIAGIENYDDRIKDTGEIAGTTKKVKLSSKLAALDSISRLMGYNAPEKKEIAGANGEPLIAKDPLAVTTNKLIISVVTTSTADIEPSTDEGIDQP